MFKSTLISRVDDITSRSYYTCKFFPYDLQVAKDCVNEGLTMDRSCWDIRRDNIYQDFRDSLSGHL